jgi:hypothetical protein
MALAGPQHIEGPAQSVSAIAGVSTDPLGLIVPTVNQHLTFGRAALGDSLVAVRHPNWTVVFDAAEDNGTYIGIPLLAVLLVGAFALRRRRIAVLAAVMALMTVLLSMGSRLHVDGSRTSIPLPFAALTHLPLLDSGIAARYMGLFWLFAALLLAVVLDAAHHGLRGDGSAVRRWGAAAGSCALALFALFPLLPAWPYSAAPAQVPTWFTSEARALPVGTGVLVYPSASSSDASAMVWQASAHMTFRMPGGYAVFATASGKASFSGPTPILEGVLALCSEGRTLLLAPGVVRSQLRAWHVGHVVVSGAAPGASCATRLFVRSLGWPAVTRGVRIWST